MLLSENKNYFTTTFWPFMILIPLGRGQARDSIEVNLSVVSNFLGSLQNRPLIYSFRKSLYISPIYADVSFVFPNCKYVHNDINTLAIKHIRFGYFI